MALITCSFIDIINPSIVVNFPPNVPSINSKSNSGIQIEHVSD